MPISEKPIAHLVWLQGRLAPDDVEDYYEVARPGDTSVDGSDPFPVYRASPSDAERHERAVPVGWFNLPNEQHGYQQVSTEFNGASGTVPLYAAPSIPAGGQEPVAVKECDKLRILLSDAYVCGATWYSTHHGFGADLRQSAIDYAQKWSSEPILSTSQSDPAPETIVSGIEAERVRLWNENRDIRASIDVERSVTDSMRIERDIALTALQSIASAHDCGCKPSCKCNTQESLEIEVEALRDIAKSAIARLATEGN
jgi:hypothetical protein